MRTSIVVCVAILLSSVEIGASSLPSDPEPVAPVVPVTAGFPNVFLPMDKLVPKAWRIIGIDTASLPVDTGKPEDGNGLAVTLQGPETVGGLKAHRETVQIWIMPADYKRAMNPSRERQAALVLRSGLSAPGTRSFGTPGKVTPSAGLDGKGYMIYYTAWGEVKSWPTWEKELRDFFGMQQLVAPGGMKQSGTAGSGLPPRPPVNPR